MKLRIHRKTLLLDTFVLGLSLLSALSLLPAWSESPADGLEGPALNHGSERWADRSEARHRGMLQKLGLSPEQSKRVDALLQRGREESQALRQQLHERRQTLMRYLKRPEATEAGARAQSAEIQSLQKRLSEMRLKTWFAIRSLLTPEQIRKLGRSDNQAGSGR